MCRLRQAAGSKLDLFEYVYMSHNPSWRTTLSNKEHVACRQIEVVNHSFFLSRNGSGASFAQHSYALHCVSSAAATRAALSLSSFRHFLPGRPSSSLPPSLSLSDSGSYGQEGGREARTGSVEGGTGPAPTHPATGPWRGRRVARSARAPAPSVPWTDQTPKCGGRRRPTDRPHLNRLLQRKTRVPDES